MQYYYEVTHHITNYWIIGGNAILVSARIRFPSIIIMYKNSKTRILSLPIYFYFLVKVNENYTNNLDAVMTWWIISC